MIKKGQIRSPKALLFGILAIFSYPSLKMYADIGLRQRYCLHVGTTRCGPFSHNFGEAWFTQVQELFVGADHVEKGIIAVTVSLQGIYSLLEKHPVQNQRK